MLTTLNELKGSTLRAMDGELGKVNDFYFDDAVWTVRYLVANPGSWLPGRRVLLSPDSLGQPTSDHRGISVRLTRRQIEDSPTVDADKPVNRQIEEELRRYYAWQPYWSGFDTEPILSPAVAAAAVAI